jgi:hypothetical protein
MYYNFIYPDIRVNPDYRFDEVMSGYNYNFSIINNWQYSGATIGGVVLSGGSVFANSISATTYLGLPSSNFTGGTITGPTTFTAGLTTNSISATTYLGLPSSNFTGGTITGPTTFTNGLTATSISATTYFGLPTDIRVTGGTYSAGTATFTNNTGGTFSVTGFSTATTFTGGTVAGLTATSISATTYLGLPTDIRVTGGTYANGTATFTNNTGGTFSVTGFTNPFTGGTVTGTTTFTGGLTATSISATTYLGLPTDIRVTGGTYSAGTATFTNNTGGTFSVTGFSTATNFTGGTVAGATIFTNGLTATSISATTYYNLPISPNNFLPLSGGTVTGGTIFQSGVTANTISQVDYIDFNVNPIVSNPTGGTLYFDATENALSYKPVTNQNDVTINLGQESLIRVYNNLGYQINNGQVLHITGSTLGVPTVALANASKLGTTFIESLAQTSGVATQDIPNGEYGFMTNFGIVRDLNTTAFTVGQEVFLSDTVDGGLEADPNNIEFTSRVSTVGYCLESNATNGKILVSITNENALQSLTQLQVNVLLGNTISTGVFNFTGITLASNTTFNVAPVEAWIVDNTTNPLVPEVLYVKYSGQTNIPSLYYSSATETYLLLTSAATITQQTTFPTPQQRRKNVYLGKMGHGNRTSLINAFNEPDADVSPLSQLRDMFTPIKLINENVYPSPNTGLTFNTSSGTLWGLGVGFINNQLNPNSLSISGNSPTTFQYRTQTGGTATNRTTIDPANYDLNGVITSIGSPAKQATNQRIYLLQNGQFRIQYGQKKYSDLTAAIAAVNTESFTTFSNFKDNAILIAILSIRSDASLLSDTLQAKITFASKFGESVGGTGGISTTTLQQAYNNSVQPEIVTNSTLGGLTIENGTGSADSITHLFEGVNSAGNTTSFIRADGYISGSTIQTGGAILNSNGLTATSISATTYLGFPTDIRVTGGTYSAGTATFTNNTGGTFSVTGFSTSSYGIVGISNSSGLYTYYPTFGSAMSASTSGQTIELFSDINETTNTTINLKNGVNINGNNHTYTLITTGTSNCFQDAGVAVNCSISNITIKRLGGTASSTNTLCLYITGASIVKCYSTKLVGGTTNMRCLTINNASAQVFGIYAEGYNPCITVTNGQLYDSTAKSLGGSGIQVDTNGTAIKCVSYGLGADGLVSAGKIIDCIGYGSVNNGITVSTGLIQNCTGYGGGGSGLYLNGTSIVALDSTGYSVGGVGILTTSSINIGLKGYSTVGYGIYLINGVLTDSTGYSTAAAGIRMENSGASISELRSCKAISTTAVAISQFNLTSGSKIFNTEAISRWNNVAGHGIALSGNNTQIVQCTVEVTNSSANCLFGVGAVSSKFANNAFAGSLTAVTSNITQSIVNTHDAQGNILI